MPATLGRITTFEVSSGTLSAILKDHFLGPLTDQLNQEVFMLETFEKGAVQWQGLQAIIPVHTGRNDGVGWRAGGGALPAAGEQTRRRLHIDARYIYGVFEIEGPALEAAKSQGPDVLIPVLTDEMDRLKDDIRDECNQRTFSGHRMLGFLNEHIDGASGRQWEFSGDTAYAAELLAGPGGGVDLTVELYRMDTYARVQAVGNAVITITAVDGAGSRLTLTTVGAVNINTAAIAVGIPIAVMVTDAAFVASNFDEQPAGIYENLAEPTHFSVDRTTATGDEALQSTLLTMSITGDHGRAGLTAQRLQGVFDTIHVESNREPNLLISHPVMRQEYTALMNNAAAAIAFDPKAGVKVGDLGLSGITFNGVPWKTSRHCGRGMLVFLETKTWQIAELGNGLSFADLDGNVISRVAGEDSWGGFAKWYYNLVCRRPNANAILVGINFSGAVDGA